MSRAARASVLFGIYPMAIGCVLMFAPNFLLGLLGLPETTEVWIHILGGLALFLGLYYVQAGRHELVPFFRATVLGRLGFAAWVCACSIYWSLPILFLFAAVDVAGALWSAWALRGATGPD